MPFTYEKRLGRRNVEGKPCKKGTPHEGEVFEWVTRDGLPAVHPDQWEGMSGLEPLPDDITEVSYIGKEE